MKEKYAKAFDEWMRRFKANPAEFMHEFEAVTAHTDGTYGASCAEYFEGLLAAGN